MDNKPVFKTDIAILGAGIGGYETFRTLAKLLKKYQINKEITIVDKNSYFTFTPMLHEVASGSIEPSHCAIPLRELVSGTPHRFLRTGVSHIDPAAKVIETERGTLSYDYAVVALGSGVNYFNTPGAAEFSYQVRTLPEAMRLREKLMERLEEEETINITVVGGGYTGIETASQLLYLVNRDLKKLYPEKKFSITVIEAGAKILANLPEGVQNKVAERLTGQGVTLLTGQRVSGITTATVELGPEKSIPSNFTIWCAGVGNVAEKFFPKTYTAKGRLPVNGFLQHELDSHLYAVGDIAQFCNPGSTTPCPQLGETAHRQGTYAATHIIRSLQKRTLKPLNFSSLGMLIPIGDWYGVAVVGKWYFFGRIAWLIRRSVYLLFMPGLSRKLRIVSDWVLHGFGFRYTLAVKPAKSE
jgi:NADH:ubiquinone reductase (H+-translocating)